MNTVRDLIITWSVGAMFMCLILSPFADEPAYNSKEVKEEMGTHCDNTMGQLIKFSDQLPEVRWFAFIDPEDKTRWLIGWRDMYHIRCECENSRYEFNDPNLTYWYPLPVIPQ